MGGHRRAELPINAEVRFQNGECEFGKEKTPGLALKFCDLRTGSSSARAIEIVDWFLGISPNKFLELPLIVNGGDSAINQVANLV